MLGTPVPNPETKCLELAPRTSNRAAAAIAVVMANQEGQAKSGLKDRLLTEEGTLNEKKRKSLIAHFTQSRAPCACICGYYVE